MSDTLDYLHAVLGDDVGYVRIGVGHDPCVKAGKYKHEQWIESSFVWPDDADQVAKELLQASAAGDDAYVCPYVGVSGKRAAGTAVARRHVHADIDGDVDIERVRELGGFAVASGSAGHGHVYVRLAESVPAHHHRVLCRGLGAYLGDADAKISDNDVLRPPGTANHKARVRGGDPTPVTWLIEPDGAKVWAPADLADRLGVELPDSATPAVANVRNAEVERVDPDGLPDRVRGALAEMSGDRSTDTMRVVGACHNAGLTIAQTRGVVQLRNDLAARLRERNDDDVLTCWLKATDARQTTPVPEVPPVPDEPIDGAAVLDEIEQFLARFVAFPSEAARVATALWAAHSHAVLVFDSSPRLALLSPEPGSGKTRTLEILELITPKPLHVLNASVAVTFRAVDAEQPTLLLDEVDAVFGKRSKDDSEDLRGLLNAGHRRGARIPRCVGTQHELKLFNVYAACALAGLGDLPDTLMSRSVVVRMRRRGPNERVQPYRQRVHEPDGHALRERIAAWIAQVSDDLGDAWPGMPPGVEDRPADCWEPLLAVADAAGGHWPERARTACLELVKVAASGEASLGVRLLEDLRLVFGEADAMHTEVILAKLHAMDEAPWGDLRGKPMNARTLARLLGNYEISSMKVKADGRSLQGYRREHLWDAWTRYLALPSGSPEPVEPPEPSQVSDLFSGSTTGEGSGTDPEPGTRTEPDNPPVTCEDPEVPEVPSPGEPGRTDCRMCGDRLSSPLSISDGVCATCDGEVAS